MVPEAGLDTEALQELEFRGQQLVNFNGQSIWPRPSAVRVAYSDASATGYVHSGARQSSCQWAMVRG